MKNKTSIWLTAVAFGALLPTAALAADLPVKARPLPIAFYDWSGIYIGGHIGYGGGMKDWDNQPGDFVARGFLGGGQVGINKQIASFVFGLELDGSWANISGSQTTVNGGALINNTLTLSNSSRIDGLVTLAGRAGIAADRWFVFAKAGLAVAHESHSFDGIDAGPLGTQTATASAKEYRVAPMGGLGAEYALGNNWSLKAEYNYIHLGSRSLAFRGTQTNPAAPFAFNESIEQSMHLVKVGANYRLGGIAIDPSYTPVPAAPGTNWSGAYIGAQGGYGWGHKEWRGIGAGPNDGKYDVNGWLAGGTVGVNAQAGVFVFGVEGDLMWTDIKGNQTFTATLGVLATTVNLETKVNWLATAAARAGFVVGDKLLVYGKAGVALAEETHSFNTLFTNGVATVTTNIQAKPLHTGVLAGAGAEYALGGNWSAKFEYNYIKMLGQAFTATGPGFVNAPPVVGTVRADQRFDKMTQDMHIFKVGLNYHFSPMPAVVSARY
jgi:outer membrane immunogenic protein